MTAFLALNIFFANNAYVATYSEHKYIYIHLCLSYVRLFDFGFFTEAATNV
jgi:hypothetical protein